MSQIRLAQRQVAHRLHSTCTRNTISFSHYIHKKPPRLSSSLTQTASHRIHCSFSSPTTRCNTPLVDSPCRQSSFTTTAFFVASVRANNNGRFPGSGSQPKSFAANPSPLILKKTVLNQIPHKHFAALPLHRQSRRVFLNKGALFLLKSSPQQKKSDNYSILDSTTFNVPLPKQITLTSGLHSRGLSFVSHHVQMGQATSKSTTLIFPPVQPAFACSSAIPQRLRHGPRDLNNMIEEDGDPLDYPDFDGNDGSDDMSSLQIEERYARLLRSAFKNRNFGLIYATYHDLIQETQPSQKFFSLFIVGFMRARQPEHMWNFFWKMRGVGIPASLEIYNTCLTACAASLNPRKAIEVREMMRVEGIEPSFRTYSTLISIYLTSNKINEAISLATKMEEQGMPPNEHTFEPLAVRWKEAYPALNLSEKLRHMPLSSRFLCNLLLAAHCENGSWIAASKVLSKMISNEEIPETGEAYPSPDGASFAIFIKGVIAYNKPAIAKEYYEKMRALDLDAELPTYWRLISLGNQREYLPWATSLYKTLCEQNHPRYMMKPIVYQFFLSLATALENQYGNDATFEEFLKAWDTMIAWRSWPTKLACKRFIAILERYRTSGLDVTPSIDVRIEDAKKFMERAFHLV